MTPFHRILFPADFSESGEAMVPYVSEMAKLCNATVTVVHSFDLVRDYNLAEKLDAADEHRAPVAPYEPDFAELRGREEAQLHRFVHDRLGGLDCRVMMEDGDPATVIRAIAERDGTDLIMMPTRGLGPFRRALLGSVTAKILHDVSCAVFTSAHVLDHDARHRTPYRSILCAVDWNEEAETVLNMARAFAEMCGARLSIVHSRRSHLSRLPGRAADDDKVEALIRSAGDTAVLHVLDSAVAEGIRRTAIDEAADLTIVGRGRDRSAVTRIWSDLYEIIRESPCPVLSV